MKIRVDTAKLQKSVQRRTGKAIRAGIVELEGALRSEIRAGIEGKRGGPRRVQGGRYLKSWEAGSTDSTVRVTVGPLTAEVVITNHVPYAEEVELGSAAMRPGLHLATAIAIVKQGGPQLLRDAILPVLKEG